MQTPTFDFHLNILVMSIKLQSAEICLNKSKYDSTQFQWFIAKHESLPCTFIY